MTDLNNIGFIVVIVCIVISRIISEKAFKLLTSDEKLKLLDSFANLRKYNIIPLALLLIVYLGSLHFLPALAGILSIMFISAIILFFVVTHQIIFRKLKILNMPKNYNRQMLLSRTVVYVGFLAFLVCIVISKIHT